jgi:two-component system KDP operon response regulator KdpE
MYAKSARTSRIAVVDDDPKMIRLLRRNLETAGYQVVTATDGVSAIELIESETPDLLVLDLVMPGMDGCEVLERLREFTWLPVVILSGRDDENDIVRGLEAGADDYVTKPFAPKELLARVRAVLRRASFGAEERNPAVLNNGDLTIDYAQHLVTLCGSEIPLTPTEYRLIACLGQNVGRTLTQDDILLRVWGQGYQEEAHLLRVNVARLRGKLGESATSTRYVATRPGVGYMMPRFDDAS